MALSKSAISLGISVLIVIVLILIVGFGVYLNNTFNISATTSSSVSTTSNSAVTAKTNSTPANNICLQEVPANATITLSSNSSTVGNYVQFTNGTRIYFPLNSCPQPVTPDLYALASDIIQNSTFISDENGSTFLVDSQAGIEDLSYDGIVTQGVVTFNEWSDQTFEPCGQGWFLKDLAQIQVGVPENSYKSFDFANLTISVVPSSELNVFMCPWGTAATVTSQSANTTTVMQRSSATTNATTVTNSESCTPAATITQSYSIGTITLCHTEGTRYSNSSSRG